LKPCKESYSIKRRQHERAFQAHYPKAAASGGGSLLNKNSRMVCAIWEFLFSDEKQEDFLKISEVWVLKLIVVTGE
jgi:hypothetical protein